MTTIYFIKNKVNQKIYVGKTRQKLSVRIGGHFSLLDKGLHYNKALQRAWKKHKRASFIVGILEECLDDVWEEREKFWINFYKSNTKSCGYNLTSGGEGGSGRVVSNKERELLRERNKKMVWTPEMRKKLSDKAKVRMAAYWTAEKRAEQSVRSKNYPKRGGWKLSEEFKEKRRNYMQTFEHTEATKEKMKQVKLPVSKSVRCVNTGKVYNSLKEAGRDINTNASNIRSQLQGKIKTILGLTFVWG